MRTIMEWTRQERQFVELAELGRLTIGELLQQNITAENTANTVKADLETVVNLVHTAFEQMNQRLMSRDEEIRRVVESIVEHLEDGRKGHQSLEHYIEKRVVSRFQEVEKYSKDFDAWKLRWNDIVDKLKEQGKRFVTCQNQVDNLQERATKLETDYRSLVTFLQGRLDNLEKGSTIAEISLKSEHQFVVDNLARLEECIGQLREEVNGITEDEVQVPPAPPTFTRPIHMEFDAGEGVPPPFIPLRQRRGRDDGSSGFPVNYQAQEPDCFTRSRENSGIPAMASWTLPSRVSPQLPAGAPGRPTRISVATVEEVRDDWRHFQLPRLELPEMAPWKKAMYFSDWMKKACVSTNSVSLRFSNYVKSMFIAAEERYKTQQGTTHTVQLRHPVPEE
jgi:hypothetical protein